MREEELLAGPLEPTNEWYAVAKIAGIKLCQAYRRQYGADFISVMPTNLYGPGDNYHAENSHVVAALIRRFHAAKEDGAASVTVWGTGNPLREFLFVDDLADACIFVLEHYSGEQHVNVEAARSSALRSLLGWLPRRWAIEASCVLRSITSGRGTAQAPRQLKAHRAGMAGAHSATRRFGAHIRRLCCRRLPQAVKRAMFTTTALRHSKDCCQSFVSPPFLSAALVHQDS